MIAPHFHVVIAAAEANISVQASQCPYETERKKRRDLRNKAKHCYPYFKVRSQYQYFDRRHLKDK